ncbi:bifunctional adenosylcobinamide kinase/adenosylcobinamide-phosphate guanylyltransferase [Nocardioides sp. JQ2195]|uniref:bifunctional adenosylcobinamide kinase/adenosylcobinamide-phosphate guanylyltransferase n=1 Tax=Nocardioides sp. JQ2195 TaxID=2592334 RepID=UPI00143E809E|nr:bifunctional adenosylcobinamide kinase/adenosylcobinamide-phosphate guanylyltransferase [Nocardioides sp. JQ2195]QIX27040.1 bifunctional adenosylcobinamide kinase/adenosylcobinamide-phosphate guanylyltransferase [Nocardioides sp. JQ2195]
MSIRVLGTGAADGWPNPFCGCASCAAARASGRVRAQTCAMVDSFLLDCGPETPRTAERCGASLTSVRHVLLTHDHPDHTAPAFLLYRSWVTSADDPLDVVGPASVIDGARQWLAPDTHVRFHVVAPGDSLVLAGGVVRVLAAAHTDDAVLYDVAAPSGRVLYATDTGPLPASTVAAARDAAYDVVLLEQTFGDLVSHGTSHLDLPAFADQVRRLRGVGAITDATDLVAVHLSHHNPPAPELARRLAAYGARIVDDGSLVGPGARNAQAPRDRAVPRSHDRDAAGADARDAQSPGDSDPRAHLRTLVIGGARSGKSTEAERLLAAAEDVTYVATSYPRSEDPEWVERVRRHQLQRPQHWSTIESLDLVGLLRTAGGPLLIDCLTLWLTRVMDEHEAWDDDVWAAGASEKVTAAVDDLVVAWRSTSRRVVAVTNEVGQGLVPDRASLRRFRDEMGRLNSRLAAETEDVRWCITGRVVHL